MVTPTSHLHATHPLPANPLALIAQEMGKVDLMINQSLASEIPLVGQVANHIIAAGGKRLRPALLLLTCGALGYQGEQRFQLAAVVEFIHTATLLHDDVVDDSALRRGNPTANQIFGNPASVLVGDFLYSRAFQLMVQTQNMTVLQMLADATNVIAEGEVQQLMHMHDPDLNEATYLQVIRSKTAKLFEASAKVGSVLAGASAELQETCAEYGRRLGAAYQIIDDILDYAGDPAILGKNLGDDLREGKTTLPLIAAMQRATPAQQALLKAAIHEGDASQLEQVLTIVKTTGALDIAQQTAAREAQAAIQAAQRLPQGPHRACLVQLAAELLERKY